MKTPRRSLLSALPALALVLAACGGPPAGDVAVIQTDSGDVAISKAQYDRFFSYRLVSAQQKESVAKVTPLAAPDFKACVAEKRKAIPAESQRKKTSDATLRKQCSDQYEQVRNQAMQDIINLDWVKAEAARRGIKFRKAEVARELNNVIKQSFGDQAGYKKFLTQSGLNQEDIELNVLGQLGQTKIVAALQKDQKEPTETEVKRYFEEKKAQYVQPETRDLRLIKVADEPAAEKVYGLLKAGGSWKTLASQYSSDEATKANGGVVLGATADTQPPEFGGTVFKAKSGTLLEPIKTSLGWYVVRVQKVTEEKQPNYAELKEQLKQSLSQENQQKSVDSFKTLFYARWGARTTCADGYDDLVACGGTDAAATTPEKLPAPPGAGTPQFPKPKVDPNAQLQQLQQQGAQQVQGATAGG